MYSTPRATKLLAAVAFCASAFIGTHAASANDFMIAVQKTPDSHDPVSENSNINTRIMYSLYDTLVQVDYRDGGKLVPGLATSWTVIDPKTLEFKLRSDVVFHNGDTFDAQDVVATFSPVRVGADKNVPVDSAQFLGGIDNIEIIAPMTVRVHMKANDALALARFANFPSQIISETALNSVETYLEFTKLDAGSGPYSLVKDDLGKEIVMKKFDKYWGDVKAAADKVTFTIVPELSTRIAGLLSGQFDIITEVGTDEMAQIDANPDATFIGGQINNIRGLFYDSTDSSISDPRIRQALNLAIDRKTLVEALYNNRVDVPHGWQMNTFGDMYLADRSAPEYNQEKAKALLEDAGYKGEEIVYRTQAGYYTKQGETAQILQSMWKAVGLNIKLEVKENWDQVTADTADRAIIDGSFTAYYPDPMGQFWRRFGPNSGKPTYWNITPEMETLGNELATSVDMKRRREIFAEMLNLFEKDPSGAILHTLAQFMGVRSDRLTMKPIAAEYMDLTTDGVSFK